MNKLAIPSILAATVLVAGIFAFMPVEKASTVHTGLGSQLTEIKADVNAMRMDVSDIKTGIWTPANRTLTVTDDEVENDDMYTLACPGGYSLMGVNAAVMGTALNVVFTPTQDDSIFTGAIVFDEAGTSDKDLESNAIGLTSSDDLKISVSETDGTIDNAVITVTVKAPLTGVCTLTETT